MGGQKDKTRHTKTSTEPNTDATNKNKTTKSLSHRSRPDPELGVALQDKAIDMVDVLRKTQANAYRIVSEIIPKTLSRLKEAISQSLVAGTADRRWPPTGGQPLGSSNDGPVPFSAPAKSRQRQQALNALIKDATAGVLVQHQQQEADGMEPDSDNEKDKKVEDIPILCTEMLQQLILDADVLNPKQLHENEDNDDDEDNQARCSGQQQLFFSQNLLEQLQQMDSEEQDDNDVASSALLAANFLSATEQNAKSVGYQLMNRVSAEMHTILDCARDLRQCIKLAKAQPGLAKNPGLAVLNKALTIILSIERISRAALLCRPHYLAAKALYTKMVLKGALSDDMQKAFDSHDKLNAVWWRHHAMSLTDACVRLLDYTSKNLSLVEGPRPNEELMKAMNC